MKTIGNYKYSTQLIELVEWLFELDIKRKPTLEELEIILKNGYSAYKHPL